MRHNSTNERKIYLIEHLDQFVTAFRETTSTIRLHMRHSHGERADENQPENVVQ